MADSITVLGNIATDPERGATATGIPTVSFRMATNHRRPDGAGGWIDAGTNWFEVKAYRALAENAAASLSKGDPVMVLGRLRVREWESRDGKRGTNVEIEADGIGPDLRWGRSVYHRMSRASAPATAHGPEGEEAAAAGAAGVDPQEAAADAWATPGGREVPF